MSRPTIIDVARAAGVSKSTVSLVLRNSPSVSRHTRENVRKAMADLGYVYNRAAANLRSAQIGLVGLVVNDLKNPFFAEFATAAQMAFSEAGLATVMASTDENPALQRRAIAALIEHGVSGLIVSPAYGDGDTGFELLERAGTPTLQVLRKTNPHTRLFPFAAPDYAAGGRLATEHLIAAGARRIAFVGGIEARSVTLERLSGYLSVLAEHGREPLIHHGRPTRAFGRECGAQLIMSETCDAAVCFNDLVALGMISSLAGATRGGGKDFRLIGFDDIEEAEHSSPSLSTIRCGISGFGKEMARVLMAWLESGTRPAPETRTPVRLVIRDSSRSSETAGPR